MKSSLIINKNNRSLNEYLIDIFKEIFSVDIDLDIKKISNKYLLYSEDKVICEFSIDYNEYMYDYIININYNDYSYNYFVDENIERLILNLMEYSFQKDDKNYRIASYGYGVSASVTQKEKGIALEIEEKGLNITKFIEIVKTLNFDDSIKDIYNKLTQLMISFDNIKIKKYTILNSCDYREKITDLLVLKDGNLLEFLTTVSNKDRKYILKKENDSYSVTYVNSSIDGLTSSYFAVDDSVNFVKKLERKKKSY